MARQAGGRGGTKGATAAAPTDLGSNHLSDADTFALLLERDPSLRSTIVAIATFDRAPEWEQLTARIERATRLSPRFRMRLTSPPLGLATPRWVVDPEFDLKWHLRRVGVPRGGDRTWLLDMARNIGMGAFDRDRPLWVFTLVDGLPDGSTALVMKVHHSLTDGIGGIQIAQHVIDLQREPSEQGAMPEAPTPEPDNVLTSVVEPIGYQVSRAVGAARDVARRLPEITVHGLTNPVGSLTTVADTALAIAHFVRPVPNALSPVMTDRSLRWNFAEIEVPLEPLRGAGHRVGCTLNDAYLAGIAGGMRIYHEGHGARVDRLRLTMPISVRSADDPEGGNRITMTRFEVPVDITNPEVRMVEIGRRAEELRADPAIRFSNQIASVLNLLPVSVTGSMLKHVDFLASNVPGFPSHVYVGGARLERFHAFGPTLGSSANITLMSYAGTCCIGVNTDAGAIPDPEVFLDALRAGFDEVLATVEPVRQASASPSTAGRG